MEADSDFDFVTLQEVWMKSDYERLSLALKEKYPHKVYFPCGVIGSGLAILSRHPISQSFLKRFTLCGSPDRFWHGDFFSGKGVGGARISLRGVTVDLYTTHLHAEYNPGKPAYTAHRLAQVQELVQFVEQTSRPEHVTIVAGDLNTTPEDFPYQMMLAKGCANRLDAPLIDAWSQLHGGEEESTGHTYNIPTSSHYNKGHPPQRLDYIFYAPRPGVICQNISLLTDAPYDTKLSLSDHVLMRAEFQVDAAQLKTSILHPPSEPTSEQRDLVLHALDILHRKRRHVINWQRFHMWVVAFMLVAFVGITIATAVTIPNDQLTPILILAFFGVQPAILVTAFISLFMARLFLQEERAALSHFINDWNLWLLHHELYDAERTTKVYDLEASGQ